MFQVLDLWSNKNEGVLSPIGYVSLSRRQLLACIASTLIIPVTSSRFIHAAGLATSEKEGLKDKALDAMRQIDLHPAWFTSANWDNAAYAPWTDYLAGKLSESEFSQVCAITSDYCLRDIWNLNREKPATIDWASRVPFNWPGVHALALRFFRTGDPFYLNKWFRVVEDYAAWSLNPHAHESVKIKRGEPAALLQSAMTWAGIFTALAILAKGLGLEANTRKNASPYAPVTKATASKDVALVSAETLVLIAQSFAMGHSVELVRYYGQPKYIPNQRMFGLEAVAYLVAFFSDADGVAALRPSLHSAIQDVMNRYCLPDGGQLEQSFNYADGLVAGAVRVTTLFARDTPVWMSDALRTVTGWQMLLSALETPQGGLPQIGNVVWGYSRRQRIDVRFAVKSMAFPYSGYYLMRSSWKPDAAYLFFYYRRAARGHSMAGCNSIQVAAYGRQLLIAGGSANYTGKSHSYPQSVAYLSEESSFKTNTVIVDGRSQNGGSLSGLQRDGSGKPIITSAPKMPIQSRWHTSENFDYVDGLFGEGYKGGLEYAQASLVKGIQHLRKVVFVRSLRLWMVIDTMKVSDAHRYTQVWKFAAAKNGLAVPGFTKEQVVLRPESHLIATEDQAVNAVNISLQQFGIPSVAYHKYFGEGYYGYVGPGPLAEAVPAVDVHATWEGKGPQVLLTVITPYYGLVSLITRTEDISTYGTAGASLEMVDGARLSVLAAATPTVLKQTAVNQIADQLLVVFERPGRLTTGIVIASEASYEFVGEQRSSIGVPLGFKWIARKEDGSMEPRYGIVDD